jgi:hypothetical protein
MSVVDWLIGALFRYHSGRNHGEKRVAGVRGRTSGSRLFLSVSPSSEHMQGTHTVRVSVFTVKDPASKKSWTYRSV